MISNLLAFKVRNEQEINTSRKKSQNCMSVCVCGFNSNIKTKKIQQFIVSVKNFKRLVLLVLFSGLNTWYVLYQNAIIF